MITNDLVLIGGSDASPVCHVDVNAAMPGVNTEEGIDITKLFPTNAVRKDDRMVFWKMTWLPAGNHQGTETGLPYLTGDYEGGLAGQTGTMTGYENRVDFTRLRYYDGGWEFYLDAELNAWNTTQKWGKDTNGDGTITADEFGGWYPVTPTETDLDIMPGVAAGEGQIVAYYLQVTDVTREVITNVADWGPAIDDSRNIGYGKNYVLLDFAVRYEDGVRNPNETGTFPYSEGSYNTAGEKYTTDKTMGFHCTEGWGDVEKRDDGTLWRKINTIMATTDKIDGYEIYMITTTRSDETKQLSDVDMSQNKRSSDGSGGYDYDTKTETVVWLKDENVRYNTEEFLLDENVAYGYRENGTHTSGVPLVDSVTIQNEHAVLVTYYVRYVGNTEDALHVHYGYFYTDLATGQCYYIPFTVMRGTESMRMAVTTDKTTSSNPHRYVMSVFPATTVYYEEYFAKYEGTWTGNTTRPDMGENYAGQYMVQQQGAYPGMTDAYNYGYDTVYGGDAKTEAATTTPGSKATFEFTGNGFEIYADCTTSTGTVMVALYKVDGQTEKMKSIYMVNTVRQSGESALTQYEGESHNTPIVSVRDLEYGDYKVVIVLTNYSAANFVFDGFRVFNTMDSAIDGKVYDKDAESQPEFVEVRDNVLVANLPNKDAIDEKSVYINQIAEGVSGQVYTLKGDQKVTAVLMTEGGAALKDADVTDYLDNGTKNEVYVRPGQYLLITLPSEEIAAKTQIGLKTLTGTATLGTKTISQTNMYYEGMNDGATIKIQNPWGTASIISVTDLKVPGGIPADSTADTQSLQSGVRQALLWMGYKEEPQPTEPEPTEPEVTEPKPTEPSTVVPGDTYVSDKAYHRGDTVVFNGKTYRAKWWTRGENPETSQVWELVDDGNQTAAPAAWSPFKIYTAGMQVTYKGRVYEAKWWTIGLAPGKGWWSAWKQIS
ncbi:MAG: carbohydrate-binding protein [Oscillospiraceae bacterium]|nr:carbohydrate-binding protein [Oscillospiraceae bacterium]